MNERSRMRSGYRRIAWLLSFLSLPGAAGQAPHGLKIVASSSIPPYVIADDDRGIAVEVLRKALTAGGYAVSMAYAPNRRAKGEFLSHRADGMYNLACDADREDFYYSAPVIVYQNIVVTLDPPKTAVHTLEDLAGVRLIAFQNAPEYLGTDFAAIAKRNPHYEEVANQSFQIDMLFSGHADAIVLDQRVFQYYLQRPSASSPRRGAYHVLPLFPPQARCAAFHDRKVRDAFNAGLEALRKDGRYQAIVDAYSLSK